MNAMALGHLRELKEAAKQVIKQNLFWSRAKTPRAIANQVRSIGQPSNTVSSTMAIRNSNRSAPRFLCCDSRHPRFKSGHQRRRGSVGVRGDLGEKSVSARVVEPGIPATLLEDCAHGPSAAHMSREQQSLVGQCKDLAGDAFPQSLWVGWPGLKRAGFHRQQPTAKQAITPAEAQTGHGVSRRGERPRYARRQMGERCRKASCERPAGPVRIRVR